MYSDINSPLTLLVLFLTIGAALASKLSPFIGIGVFLYQWGVVALPIGAAAWLGFKVFAIILLTAIVTMLLTLTIAKVFL